MGKKSKSSTGKKKTINKDSSNKTNLNAETIESLARLETALADLDSSRNMNNVNNNTSSTNNEQPSLDLNSQADTTKESGNNKIDEEDSNFHAQDESLADVIIPEGLPLNHWKDIPDDLQQAYKLLNDGAELVKSTATKYTLIGKISVDDGSQRCNDLRQGCEIIATGALLIHEPSYGCARPTRHYVKQHSRSIVASVKSLIESFVTNQALLPNSNIGAQKTGAVWNSCDGLLSQLPKGNRICMRREIFTWAGDCNETMEEFQELLNLDVRQDEGGKDDGEEANCNNDDGDNDGWDDFCENIGTGDGYTEQEKPIAAACVALIKCSRGVLNLTMKACEVAGSQSLSNNNESNEARQRSLWQWISDLHEIARFIGEEVTELGSLLYPPLNIDLTTETISSQDGENLLNKTNIGRQVLIQKMSLMKAIDYIIDAKPPGDDSQQFDISGEVLQMANKLRSAVTLRSKEAESALLKKS